MFQKKDQKKRERVLNSVKRTKIATKEETVEGEEEKTVENSLPSRMRNVKLYIGAHVSISGGLFNAVLNSKKINGNAFALFLKSQRRWENPPLTQDQIRKFRNTLLKEKIDPAKVIPHGSYLINIGNPDEEKREKSLESMLDDVQRCQNLGLPFYNFHPGSTVGACSVKECISFISKGINEILEKTENVTILLENMVKVCILILGWTGKCNRKQI